MHSVRSNELIPSTLTLSPDETIGNDRSNVLLQFSEIGFIVPRFDIECDHTLGNDLFLYNHSHVAFHFTAKGVTFRFLRGVFRQAFLYFFTLFLVIGTEQIDVIVSSSSWFGFH